MVKFEVELPVNNPAGYASFCTTTENMEVEILGEDTQYTSSFLATFEQITDGIEDSRSPHCKHKSS